MSRYIAVDADGKQQFVSLDNLRAWHAQGLISGDTLVISEDTGSRIPVSLLLTMQPVAPAEAPLDSGYEFLADKVGFVPNAKKKDNLFQAKVFGIVWLVCVIAGGIWGVATNPNGFAEGLLNGLLTGGLLGVVVALLVSGAITGARTTLR